MHNVNSLFKTSLLMLAVSYCVALRAIETELPSTEAKTQARILKGIIKVTGRVVDANGQPLVGAGATLHGTTVLTNTKGVFLFKRAPRTNGLLTISAPGYRDEIIALHLALPSRSRQVAMGDIGLTPADGAVRMLFGGDTMFGRRFLDPDTEIPFDQMPLDDPLALIQVSDPLPGSKNVVQFIKPFYQEADFGVVNLETPVTDNPATPHPTKDFVFFTLPGSLPALLDLGVDYVSLGNNHVYDYLDAGVVDTRTHLDNAGIPHSGMGLTPEEAYAAYRVTLGGHPYALLSSCAVSGSQHAVTYVADDTKGGAADARVNADFAGSIERERDAGYIPIMQIHGGIEYTFEPSAFLQGRIDLAAVSGAALVVCHHTHVAQGFSKVGDVLAIHNPGNLAIDQARVETMLGLLIRADMDGATVRSLRSTPVYIEDFRPKPVGGRLAGVLLRRIGESSRPFGVLHYPYNNQGYVSLAPNDHTVHDRTVIAKLTVPESGVAMLDLRLYGTGDESLIAARTVGGGSGLGAGQIGRDLLEHGDFEDYDTDPDRLEVERWDVESESRYASVIKPFRGLACVRSTRSSERETDSILPLRNRIRVFGDAIDQPNKDLSLFGYITGQKAGPVSVYARIGASVGDKEFGEVTIYERAPGSYKWQPFLADIPMPPEDPDLPPPADEQQARAVRVFFRHSPPNKGFGVVGYDELAIVNWEETFDMDAGGAFTAPHPREFIRVTGAPGKYTVSLTFRSFRPATP
ncbi:MAG: hypothetical protein AMXMBFR7_36450 [Planctomycetota bacterium]